MSRLPLETITARLAHVRAALTDASIDALVVTHLANIRYLTGFEATAGAVIVDKASCALVADFRYVTMAHELAASLEGLVTVEAVDRSYDEAIVAALDRKGSLRVGIEAAYLPVARFNAISAALAGSAPTPLRTANPMPVLVPTERLVERGRMIKDAGEIATLREAGRRLSTIARRVREFATPGRTEREVARLIDAAMEAAGFSRPAFDTIVAFGLNSAHPHARPTDMPLEGPGPTVLDFGGVYDGYCVDLTRTVQLGAVSTDVQRLYEAVAEAQRAAIGRVRPGVRPSEVDAAARSVLERYGLGAAFGHGTGHGLGLEVHEEPRVTRASAGQPDEPLEPGVVFTIEPGAYVPGIGGVRIEDDVLVTPDGCERLTDAPQLFL
jgi:Xaa-Pro aminopeptidase